MAKTSPSQSLGSPDQLDLLALSIVALANPYPFTPPPVVPYLLERPHPKVLSILPWSSSEKAPPKGGNASPTKAGSVILRVPEGPSHHFPIL